MFFVSGMMGLLLQPQEELRRWIERLGAESIEEREIATNRLLEAGEGADPELERAAAGADPEVDARIRLLLRARSLRKIFPSEFVESIPGIELHLANGDDSAWTQVFLESLQVDDNCDPRYPDLSGRTYEALGARALRGAKCRRCGYPFSI